MQDSPTPSADKAATLADLAVRLAFLVRARLWLQIVLALVLGAALGLALSPSGGAVVSSEAADLITGWLVLPGHLFLALIQMIVVPLVLSSIMVGLGSAAGTSRLRDIGLRIAPYFLCTTTGAVGIGLGVALLVRPGELVDRAALEAALAQPGQTLAAAPLPTASLHDRIVGLIPSNPLAAALDQSMLQLVVFAILMGVALTKLPRRQRRVLLDLATSVQQLSMEIVSWAMVIAPLAVLGLITQITARVGLTVITGMAAYVATVLAGLFVLLASYVGLAWLVGGRPPAQFLRAIREAQLLAFCTSSSAAVMPLSIRTAEDGLGVRSSVAQFVVPLGAAVNMDGTALYQVVAAAFLAQVFQVDLTPGSALLLITTTVGASIGAPSTPGVGIVILATILEDAGIPGSGVALILGVDRILDMSRTAVNVTGDLTACAVVEKWLPPDFEAPAVDDEAGCEAC